MHVSSLNIGKCETIGKGFAHFQAMGTMEKTVPNFPWRVDTILDQLNYCSRNSFIFWEAYDQILPPRSHQRHYPKTHSFSDSGLYHFVLSTFTLYSPKIWKTACSVHLLKPKANQARLVRAYNFYLLYWWTLKKKNLFDVILYLYLVSNKLLSRQKYQFCWNRYTPNCLLAQHQK